MLAELDHNVEQLSLHRPCVFITGAPGIQRAQEPIARELSDNKGRVITSFIPSQIDLAVEYVRAADEPCWLFFSSDVDPDKLRELRETIPETLIGFIEQTEGDAARVLSKLDRGLLPNLVLTISQTSAHVLMRAVDKYPYQIFPLGNAEFDQLTTFDFDENRKVVRAKLWGKDAEDKLLISVIGRPRGSMYGHPDETHDVDLDEILLLEIRKSIKQIETESGRKIELVYVPHPSDTIKRSIYPRFIELGITPLELCAASDLCLTVRSTLALQVSLLLVDHANAAAVLHLVPSNLKKLFEKEALPQQSTLLRTGGAPYVDNLAKLTNTMEQYLFNEEARLKHRGPLRNLLSDHRVGPNTGPRAAFFISLYEEYGHILNGFQNAAFPLDD